MVYNFLLDCTENGNDPDLTDAQLFAKQAHEQPGLVISKAHFYSGRSIGFTEIQQYSKSLHGAYIMITLAKKKKKHRYLF